MTLNDISEGSQLKESIICILIGLAIITWLCLSAGVITLPEPKQPPAPSTVNVTPAPITTAPTPIPTPEAIPDLEIEYVDPFAPGERTENQWYKWFRADVQGKKDMEIGIVAYRHKFLDRYTWWSAVNGNYFTQRPTEGNRYFAVWVNEEMFGNSTEDDPSFWAFDDRAFALNVKGNLITSQNNLSYIPTNRIKEFDDYVTYHGTVTAPPFGYYIRYSGNSPATAGLVAEKLAVLRMGPGNSHDGFILFEVPKETQLKDITLLGEFGTFGRASWRFAP